MGVFTIDKSTGASRYTVGEVRDLLLSCGYSELEVYKSIVAYLEDEYLTD